MCFSRITDALRVWYYGPDDPDEGRQSEEESQMPIVPLNVNRQQRARGEQRVEAQGAQIRQRGRMYPHGKFRNIRPPSPKPPIMSTTGLDISESNDETKTVDRTSTDERRVNECSSAETKNDLTEIFDVNILPENVFESPILAFMKPQQVEQKGSESDAHAMLKVMQKWKFPWSNIKNPPENEVLEYIQEVESLVITHNTTFRTIYPFVMEQLPIKIRTHINRLTHKPRKWDDLKHVIYKDFVNTTNSTSLRYRLFYWKRSKGASFNSACQSFKTECDRVRLLSKLKEEYRGASVTDGSDVIVVDKYVSILQRGMGKDATGTLIFQSSYYLDNIKELNTKVAKALGTRKWDRRMTFAIAIQAFSNLDTDRFRTEQESYVQHMKEIDLFIKSQPPSQSLMFTKEWSEDSDNENACEQTSTPTQQIIPTQQSISTQQIVPTQQLNVIRNEIRCSICGMTGHTRRDCRRKPCSRCGSFHNNKPCRALGKTCFNCGKAGHLSKACRSKQRGTEDARFDPVKERNNMQQQQSYRQQNYYNNPWRRRNEDRRGNQNRNQQYNGNNHYQQQHNQVNQYPHPYDHQPNEQAPIQNGKPQIEKDINNQHQTKPEEKSVVDNRQHPQHCPIQ